MVNYQNITYEREGYMSLKSKIYKILRIWNDVDAVRKGRIGKRVGRRVTGRTTGRIIRRLFK